MAALGIGILGVRFLTVPVDGPSAAFTAGVLGIAAIFVILTLRGSAQRRRRRRLLTAHPERLVMPIVGNVDTSAATRWLAAEVGDPHLALRPERAAFLIADAEGIRLSDGRATSGLLPVDTLSLLPFATVKAGIGRIPALVIGVTVGTTVVPIPVTPARSRVFAAGRLSDAELRGVSASLEAALAGEASDGDWEL